MGDFIAGLIFGVSLGMMIFTSIPNASYYQVRIEDSDSSFYIYSDNHLLEVIPWDTTQTLTKILLKDNE